MKWGSLFVTKENLLISEHSPYHQYLFTLGNFSLVLIRIWEVLYCVFLKTLTKTKEFQHVLSFSTLHSKHMQPKDLAYLEGGYYDILTRMFFLSLLSSLPWAANIYLSFF